MGNQAFLKQARDGVIRLIKESPTDITIKRAALVDDGAGNNKLIEDPYDSTPEEITFTVRLSHEQRQAPNYGEVQAGFSTNLSRFIMSRHTDVIYENDTFLDNGTMKYFRIGPVDPLIKFGGVIGYQAPLIESEDTNEDS